MVAKFMLGDALRQRGIINEEQLKLALQQQRQTGAKLGQVMVDMGFVDEDTLLDLLAEQLSIPRYDLKHLEIDFKKAKFLPEAYARKFRAVLLKDQGDEYLVGMSDPLDIKAIDELGHVLDRPLNIALIKERELAHALDLIYRRTDEISDFAKELHKAIVDDNFDLQKLSVDQAQIDAPVIKLLRSLFEDAVQVRASDIHIEPGEQALRIRLRIDGVLYEQIMKEKDIASAIALRLKIMSGLNIAEERLPQDGRFNIKVRDRIIDVRLSTMPTQYGESVVMRLLDQSEGILSLSSIGMTDDMLERFRHLCKSPNGIILVTGPTGSGKSTTLYGALSELNNAEKKIITVEDPVEYRLPRINQVQTNEKIDLTFARVLRTALRQDPDIIMVGEMRDHETAEIAVRAALTGHLVLSTLHTNDSASSALRLIDMGVDGYLVGATLRGILAQRLVRRVCDDCKEKYTLSDQEKSWLRGHGFETNVNLYCGTGCSLCNHSGYKGRIGVYELLEFNKVMIDALSQRDLSRFSEEAQIVLKGKLLIDGAIALMKLGVTTLSEVIRITGEL